jgi:TonB family protein
VDRSGQIPKLVIASASGTATVDRAAVAAISSSAPFPSFPKEYRGDSIKLQIDLRVNAR